MYSITDTTIKHNKKILDGITDKKIKDNAIKIYVLTIWFELLARVKTMNSVEFNKFSTCWLDYIKTLDPRAVNLIKPTLNPMYINVYKL